MKMKDERKEKIRDLKNQIKLQEEAAGKMLDDLDIKKEMELPEEERKQRQLDFKSNMALKKAEISTLKEELKQVRLNKHSSSFFSFKPNKGMNRRQAKAFRKQRNRV